MKQEKKPTVWCDIESRLEPWQENAWGQLSGGLKNGQLFIISSGRGTGKSHMAAMYMAATAVFGSSWLEWEDTFVWPWSKKLSVESHKLIWGRIMMRKHVAMYGSSPDGTIAKEYATKKEVFQRKLRGTD